MLNAYIERIRAAWNGLSPNQRVAVAAVAISATLAVAFLMLMRPPQRFETAFSGLASEDAAAIVEELRAQGTPYELSADGTTIRVPSEKVAEVRLDAASKGLPKEGSAGFELFDKSSFGITDFAQRVNYQRAIEGELERTIDKIDAVSASRVHIVMPEESLFTRDQQPTTAAVVLQLRPGRELTASQIRGITHLVSSAVPNLKPENLTVIDSAGNPIWSGTEGDAAMAGVDDHFRMQQAYEANLEQQLQTLVSRVVGAGHAVVRVSAVLNWDQRSTESEIFSPDGTQPQIRSQQERSQTTSAGTTTAAGEPGVDSNVETYQEGAPGQSGQESSSRDVTTNYELSRRVEHVVQAPGQLQRLAVAVVLDGKQVEPAVAQEIQNVVSTAAGLIPQRGDTITVSAVPFSDLAQETDFADAGPSLLERALQVLKVVGLILVPLVALLFARRILLKQRVAAQPVPATAGAWPPPEFATQRITVNEAPAHQTSPQPGQTRQLAYQQVVQLAKSDPSQVAQMIRIWMSEEQ